MHTPVAKKLGKTTLSQDIAPNRTTLTGNSGPVSEYFVSGELTGKERDPETGLYYYGARYLDPRTSRWLSVDPAMGEYIPLAPINDDAKKHNENLPGMGGIFNYVNFHVYHYAGNNPVKLIDPDGRFIIVTQLPANTRNIHQIIRSNPQSVINARFRSMAFVPQSDGSVRVWDSSIAKAQMGGRLRLENRIDNALRNIMPDTRTLRTFITASAEHIGDGIYQINLEVTTIFRDPLGDNSFETRVEGTIAYATAGEVGVFRDGDSVNQARVNRIANDVLAIVDINRNVVE